MGSLRGAIPALDALFCPQQDIDGHDARVRGSTSNVTRRAWRMTLDSAFEAPTAMATRWVAERMIETMPRKHLSSLISASIVAVFGGGLCMTLGCAAADPDGLNAEEIVDEAEEALTGFSAFTAQSTTNFTGTTISPDPSERCFLSGVAGNLNQGLWVGGSISMKAAARVSGSTLFAHGGAFTDQHNARVPYNNLVKASTACLPSSYVASAMWSSNSGGTSPPVWIAALGTSLRQCFLTGVTGVDGSWNSSTRFARVVKITTTDATHSSTGWYIEGNLIDDVSGSHATISADCADFPTGTEFASGMAYATEDGTTSVPIGGSLGSPVVKGCALTEINGAFNLNNASEGIVITAPSVNTGLWTITVTNSRLGRWACAK
ncbi:hypothetical protein [Polyangium fumosum]|uniref:Uncharacterized protein n=1 Tax=Polyangium fumosum TaxID=889272 RepID=A0A4U1J9C2_9BACT|nr:hypothetical protein [Polyangium fumosum]TKD03221.1 hypothetical protein E8A74_27300 [Polyangium fumosum]